jgi:menaquinone-dependent protoporphyrinogen oxidase
MNTLIAYTTKYGSAAKCANLLQEQLHGDVQIVNVKTDPIPDLNSFDAVILGGSIYVGQVQKELKAFCQQHLDALLTKKVGLFVCAAEEDPAKQVEQLKNAFPAALYDHAAAAETLGDELHYEKLSFFEKLAVRLLKGDKASYSHLSAERVAALAAAMNS